MLPSVATTSVLGAPASIIGSELSSLLGSGPSLFVPPQTPKNAPESGLRFLCMCTHKAESELQGQRPPAPWPIGAGDWSELCIASGTFRETMGRRTGVSALRNPGGTQLDVH